MRRWLGGLDRWLRQELDAWFGTVARWTGLGMIFYEFTLDHLRNPGFVLGGIGLALLRTVVSKSGNGDGGG